jgi:hypothetical protein
MGAQRVIVRDQPAKQSDPKMGHCLLLKGSTVLVNVDIAFRPLRLFIRATNLHDAALIARFVLLSLDNRPGSDNSGNGKRQACGAA